MLPHRGALHATVGAHGGTGIGTSESSLAAAYGMGLLTHAQASAVAEALASGRPLPAPPVPMDSSTTPAPRVCATQSWRSEQEGYLTLEQGDVIIVTDQPEEEWWTGRPESQQEALARFEAAGALQAGLQAEAERVSTARQIYLNAPGIELAYAASSALFNTTREIRRLLKEAWAILDDYDASTDNTTAFDEIYRWRNMSNPRDTCGVCGGDNATCLGCDDDRLANHTAPRHDFFLPSGNHFGRQFDTKVSTRHHDAITRGDDVIKT